MTDLNQLWKGLLTLEDIFSLEESFFATVTSFLLFHCFNMSIRSSYNEETIVSLIKEYYSLLVSLAYLHASQVIHPPPSSHAINELLCNQLGLDAAVISLMKKIPYIDGPYSDGELDWDSSAYGCMLFPGSYCGSEAYSFLRDYDIVESRDPEGHRTVGWRLNYLLSHDVALAHNLRDGMSLVLDTKASMTSNPFQLGLGKEELMRLDRHCEDAGQQ